MKFLKILSLSFCALLLGCGSNSFEDAFNPFTGSKEKATKWRDQGGLDKQKNFYGVNIVSITSRFQENGMPASLRMEVDSGTSPESMRNALAKACQANSSEFRLVPNFPRGSILKFPIGEKPGLGMSYKLSCIYEGDLKLMHISSSLSDPNQK